MEATTRYPLGYDSNGDPVEIPAEAVAWRVRRGGGRPGRPRVVFNPDTGRQLEVRLDATIEELIAQGCPPGRYRLEAVDREGRVIPGVVAVTEIPEDSANEGEPESRLEVLAQALRHSERQLVTMERQSETLCRALEALAAAFGPMRPAQMPPLMVTSPAEEPMKPEQIAQTVATIAKSVAGVFSGGGGGES